jgi:hypothetical protein
MPTPGIGVFAPRHGLRHGGFIGEENSNARKNQENNVPTHLIDESDSGPLHTVTIHTRDHLTGATAGDAFFHINVPAGARDHR